MNQWRTVIGVATACVILLLPKLSMAMGFGDIHLYSHLHQPLNARIELLNGEDFPVNTVKVALASSRDFLRAGIDRPYFLTQFNFDLRRRGGKTYVKVTTKHPIHEPAVELLVDLRWPDGHLVKAYTLLIEPNALRPESRFSQTVDPSEAVTSKPAVKVQAQDTLTDGQVAPPAGNLQQKTIAPVGTMSGPSLPAEEQAASKAKQTTKDVLQTNEVQPGKVEATETTVQGEQATQDEPTPPAKPVHKKPIWQRFLSEIILSTLMLIISIYMSIKIILNRRMMEQAGRFQATTKALAEARSKEQSNAVVNPMAEMAESVADEVSPAPVSGLDLEQFKKLQASDDIMQESVTNNDTHDMQDAQVTQEATERLQDLADVQPETQAQSMSNEVSESSFEPATTMDASIKSDESESNYESSTVEVERTNEDAQPDVFQTKLKLAKQYLAMGDKQTAQRELEDIVQHATGLVADEAAQILENL